jgi:hypothetical protein
VLSVDATLFANQFVISDVCVSRLGVLRYGIALLFLLPFRCCLKKVIC